jgi:hypothetical protein
MRKVKKLFTNLKKDVLYKLPFLIFLKVVTDRTFLSASADEIPFLSYMCGFFFLCPNDNEERKSFMKEIFQEYGGILITVVAILSVILVVVAVVGTDEKSAIGLAFANLINSFVEQANSSIGIE